MPAELCHPRRKRARRLERNAAAVMQAAAAKEVIEAQPPYAEPCPPPKLGQWRFGIGDRDAAQPLGMAREGVEHRAVVAPVRAALHQDATREAKRLEHAEIFRERGVGRRVAAIRRVGKPRGRSEHVRMSVARVGWKRDLRPGGLARRRAGSDHGDEFRGARINRL